MAKGYDQEEGIDYDETFTPITRLKAFRMLLPFGTLHGHQVILNGCDIYIC